MPAHAPRQMQDFMRMYSNLVERCFTSCCNDFTSKALSTKEVRVAPRARVVRALSVRLQSQCVANCADKFLKHSERVGARFAEQNAGAHSAV
jgi:import inner membrane translocase subunit TIM9